MKPFTREVLGIFAACVLGVIAGYASVALAPTGWVLVGFLSVLLLAMWIRRNLLRLGIFVAFLGATPLALLAPIVIGSGPCPIGPSGVVGGSGVCDPSYVCQGSCYAPSTTPALVVFTVILLLGLWMFVVEFVRAKARRANAPGS